MLAGSFFSFVCSANLKNYQHQQENSEKKKVQHDIPHYEHKQQIATREGSEDDSPMMRALAESQTRGTFQDAYQSPNSSMNRGNSEFFLRL